MKNLYYYFDFLSPYSYLSWQKHKTFLDKWTKQNIQMTYIPVSLATIIHFHETKGPAEIVSKRNYLFKDCLRYSLKNDILFNPPEELPFNSLYALRCALIENAGESQFTIIDTIFCKGWEEGRDIGNPDIIINILNEQGLDGSQYINRVTEKDIRKSLKLNVKNAQENDVFGVPTFIYENELFWGNDSIENLDLFISGKEKIDLEKYNSFVKNYGAATDE
ncbi:MAG: thioredoxin domain-containing protein [Bacteriovoracaceae bacterium]|jgi:2-hydroxychromene-2-carboxylate isomerase|nr:thioredoxin domain-containing protein [Bacteriovoracaceae bacterium]